MIYLMFIATGQKLEIFSKFLSIQTLFTLLVIVNVGLVLCAVLKTKKLQFLSFILLQIGYNQVGSFLLSLPHLASKKNFPLFIQIAHLKSRMNLTVLVKKQCVFIFVYLKYVYLGVKIHSYILI